MINTERLRKLADFLYDLPRDKFDFNTVQREAECGTVGCAIGWTPSVFPDLVEVAVACDSYRGIRIAGTQKLAAQCGGLQSVGYVSIGVQLFGVSDQDSYALFTPGMATPDGQDALTYEATPRQVAERIRRFADWAEAQKDTNDQH